MKKEKKKQEVGIPMTSMVDILFILLTFFIMLSSIKKDNIAVKAPKVKTNPDKKENKTPPKEIVISLDKKSQIFINGNAITSYENLKETLKKIKRENAPGTEFGVIFRTDGESRNEQTSQVLAALSECDLMKNLRWEVEGGGS